MGFFSTIKKEAKRELDKRKELRQIENKALHEARKKQAIVYGRKKAAAETKMRLTPKKHGGTGDILEAIAGTTGKKRKGNALDDIKKFI